MIQIYHPSKSNKGFAASFWISNKDGTVFATLIRQSGWDDQRQVGIFKDNLENPDGRVNIKLSLVEVSAIIDCIERNRPFSTYHQSEDKPKTINFTPWNDQSGNPKGFSFSIVVTDKQDNAYKNSLFIGFTFSEARLIREFLVFALHNKFAQIRNYNTITKNIEAITKNSETTEVAQSTNVLDGLI